jgi:hypothetical protein
MKHLPRLEFTIAALLLSAAPLAGQCTPVFSFSVYNDGSVSADETTVYGYTSTEDTSTLCSCSHSAYIAMAALYDPNGTYLGETEQSGFSSSTSAATDGVSGNYQSSGAGAAYCSCLQGEFGGGGTMYPIAVLCPTTISLASTQALNLSYAYPTKKTGIGIMTTMQVGSGMNGASVYESLSGTNYCPSGFSSACNGMGTPFIVGPGSSYNASGYSFGAPYSGSGNNQFLDEHYFVDTVDDLAGQISTYSCTQVCTQTYSACNKPIGTFTVTYTFQHSSISGTAVTSVGVTKH